MKKSRHVAQFNAGFVYCEGFTVRISEKYNRRKIILLQLADARGFRQEIFETKTQSTEVHEGRD